MSNFYAKAINPRTKKIEKAVMLDTVNGFFLEFKDGWKYNLKENPDMVITEQEAINDDVDLGDPISPQEASMYFIAGLFVMIPLLLSIVYCIKYVWSVFMSI